jgi:hypothetical protein
LKCGRCNHATLRRRPNQNIKAHKNPKTGKPCEGDGNGKFYASTLDLAHAFFTDVLQVRTGLAIPKPATLPTGIDAIEFASHVARTEAETLRLAAIDILSIPEQELTASFRWTAMGHLELILSDSVPGGAGYVGKLREIGATKLFNAARKVATCPKHCTGGCSSCLRSYSNQFHWDSFRRQEALEYLSKVAKQSASNPILESGGSSIKEAEAEKLLEDAAEIVWFSQRLGDFTGPLVDDSADPGDSKEPEIGSYLKGIKRLRRWLIDGKKVLLGAVQIPDFKAYDSPKARRFAECLSPEIHAEKLRVLRLEKGNHKNPLPLAVLRGSGAGDWTAIYCLHGSPSLVNASRMPDALYRRDIPDSDLKEILAATHVLPATDFEVPEGSIKRFVLEPGRNTSQELEAVIQGLLAIPLSTLRLQDRYCVASDGNLDAAIAFFSEFSSVARSQGLPCPEEVQIHAGPLPSGRRSAERDDWKKRLAKLESRLRKEGFWKDAKVRSQFISGGHHGAKDFHDRYLEGRIKPSKQGEKPGKVILEMTGGIDIVMDSRERTRLYLCNLGSSYSFVAGSGRRFGC